MSGMSIEVKLAVTGLDEAIAALRHAAECLQAIKIKAEAPQSTDATAHYSGTPFMRRDDLDAAVKAAIDAAAGAQCFAAAAKPLSSR